MARFLLCMRARDSLSLKQREEDRHMNTKTLPERRHSTDLVVAPASASTWAVAFSRQLIPGALFRTKTAAVNYARMLAIAAGLGRRNIKVLA